MSEGVVVFMLGRHGFALPAGSVRECLPLPLLQRRPGMPAHVAGFFSLGGQVLPVLDLASLLGLERDDTVEADGLYRHLIRLDEAALLVDRITLLAARVPAPADLHPDRWQHGCIEARLLVAGEPVALLDPGRILQEGERQRLRSLARAEARRAGGWDGSGADAA